MLLNDRHESVDSDAYRYGFNGMERDDEIKGSGNSYDFGARMYDNRIGRWFAIDKLSAMYPQQSPFN
jgi:RHS repeat-associated protein